MFKLVNSLLVVATLLTASVLYGLEHDIRGLERSIAREKTLGADTAEEIKLLKAEWSSLTRPERVQKLAQENLGMVPMSPDQVVTQEELDTRLNAISAAAETTASTNPIDDVLKKMQ